jgi:hypothetical protein
LINREKYKTLTKNPGLGEIATQYRMRLRMQCNIERCKKSRDHSDEHEIAISPSMYGQALKEKRADRKSFKKWSLSARPGGGGSQLLAVKYQKELPQLRILGFIPPIV